MTVISASFPLFCLVRMKRKTEQVKFGRSLGAAAKLVRRRATKVDVSCMSNDLKFLT